MDTYGHLFPGQEADTVARLPDLLSDPKPEAVRATGTYDETSRPASGCAARRRLEAASDGKAWRIGRA